MIEFVIVKNINSKSGFKYSYEFNNGYLLQCEKIDNYIEKEDKKLIIIGDCINFNDFSIEQIGINEILNSFKGNFYAFLSDGQNLFITSSAFGLLPIYYLNDFAVLSSSVKLIKNEVNGKMTENKKWLINQLLFNYQLGTDTIFQEIELFPTMSYLFISNNEINFNKYYRIRDEFLSQPISWKKALPDLSEKFIRLVAQYIPDKKAVISFTGGFDGRTLVSIATHFRKDFTSFSYGKITNDDVYIPKANAEDLGIPYFWLNLNEDYSKLEYFNSAFKFIQKTDGSNGFLYAHVEYLATKVKEKGNVLLSGICGSELFRAAHSSGAVTSKALIDLFRLDTFESYRDSVINLEVLRYLKNEDYNPSINEVLKEAWEFKLDLEKKLDKNKSLYVFVYEEIFRKFFGPWVKSQMNTVCVRTPYIDFSFFKEIIKTELSGAYSDFLTDNPIKRYKGQVFYAEVIRKTNKKLFWTKTGKGYSPAIVNKPILRPFLAIPFLSKRLNRRVIKTDFDNLGIITGIKQSIPFLFNISHLDIDSELLKDDLVNLHNTDRESYRDTILMSYSILMYYNYLNNE